MTAYDRLVARFARIATVNEASAMLGWDASAMMPPGGGAARGDQLAVLAGVAHSFLVAPDVAADLDEAEAGGPAPDPWRAANLHLMRHAHTRAVALPPRLVEAQARANSACEKVWREARRTADFVLVRPFLEEVVRLVREVAAALAPALGLAPYDALMNGFQRGIGAAELAPIFADYEAFLRRSLPIAEERQARLGRPLRPQGPFPIAAQEALCRCLAERFGLDFTHARLDRSAHPFSGGTPTDVRITTRYDETDFTQAVLAVVHETG
ncbi:MAG: carboxypeptidase M32, partial [Pseudomonadota bacterium]|nr:carboxypeptidase M32 [Pseudomonadota bacterium]